MSVTVHKNWDSFNIDNVELKLDVNTELKLVLNHWHTKKEVLENNLKDFEAELTEFIKWKLEWIHSIENCCSFDRVDFKIETNVKY